MGVSFTCSLDWNVSHVESLRLVPLPASALFRSLCYQPRFQIRRVFQNSIFLITTQQQLYLHDLLSPSLSHALESQCSELRTMSARTSATDRAFVWSKPSSKRHLRGRTRPKRWRTCDFGTLLSIAQVLASIGVSSRSVIPPIKMMN